MADPDGEGTFSTSEVGRNGQQEENLVTDGGTKLLNTMDALLNRVLATSTALITDNNTHSSAIKLIQFDPDEAGADIEGWCKLTEIIIKSKHLDGVDLLMALMGALKGRAASYLTKINLDELTWDMVKQSLMAKFFEPKLIQDYFDEVLRFQIAAKETATEAALRLWNLIERIPQTHMSEEVITGFVISVLCQKDGLIRRELNARSISSKTQLFRVLGSVSLKRRLEVIEIPESSLKRPRLNEARWKLFLVWINWSSSI